MLRTAILPLVIAALLLAGGHAAQAETPVFGLPAACTIGDDCWIVNYVDTAPDKGTAQDFSCGAMTYDDHNGTDIALPDLVAMQTGVDVVAAASGKVLRVRDGVEDKTVSDEERAELLATDRGCGNGVFIDHGDGWQTIYCHMKKGSITVRPDQRIKNGQKLGQIGNSGIAEFPHLHFGIFHNGEMIDPFTGHDTKTACGAPDSQSLWKPDLELAYTPAIIYAAGFHSDVPSFDAIKIDSAGTISMKTDSAALTYWAAFYGVAAGDKIRLEIRDPAGVVFAEREIVQDKTRARQFYFIGKKAPPGGFTNGKYTGNVQIERPAEKPPLKREKSSDVIVR